MQERTLFRIGAVSLIVGFVLTIVHVALLVVDAPLSDPGDTEAFIQSIVDSSIWAGIHVLVLVPLLLGVGGLLALYRSITGEPGGALAGLGFAGGVMGGAITAISVAILGGGAMKELPDAWAAAADKEVPFAVAKATILVRFDIGSWGNLVFYGVAPILYGLAISLTGIYPKWLGWVAVVGGVGGVLIQIVQFSQGVSLVTSGVYVASFLVVTLWLVVMGVLMWRKAGAAA